MKKMRNRFVAVLDVVGSLLWRGFGLFLFILGGSAGVGAVVSGSWITGVVIAWGTLMIGVVGAVGYAIATTGRADSVTVETAVQDAVQKAKEQQDSK
jgi:hypothetical protein